MRSLLSIILVLGFVCQLQAQSPHGTDFKRDCASCHNSDSWEIPNDAWNFDESGKPTVSKMTGLVIPTDTTKFNHFRTDFPLNGQHAEVDCRACHETLVFSEASTDCISCHTDIHRQTVGTDCARCHSIDHWLVDNITELHEDNGFPLLGAHAIATCTDCHTAESELEFNRIGNACINCHLEDFTATTNPNHVDANFGINCIDCHTFDGFDWVAEAVNHDFFPLTQGHDIQDCAACHTGGNFADTPTDCIACHETDFNTAQNPNHIQANFSTTCTDCHTIEPDWMPAEFVEHDNIFPIYSGSHEGTWSTCVDCHTNTNNYAEFTCISCHINPETDEGHENVTGYVYENSACLACHPTGDIENSFNHDETAFPLTGVHITTDCIACHANGFTGTPTDCAACHTQDFNETTNPNHTALGLSADCVSCHTTDSGWSPANFDIHDEFYPLNGAHAAIANDCAMCHADGNFNNTPNTCAGCHTEDFNQTTNPDHEAAQFPTDCESCHSETAWTPSSFNHDEFYVLDGAHAAIAEDCAMCHIDGNFSNTPNTCAGCHTQDFSETVNPNHTALNLSTDCESCHTTQPDWMPATFDVHDEFYALNGAHAAIANDCAACHNGDYTSTPNTCFGCHSEDYNQTTNPNHQAAQFSTDCASCHSESEWIPATFDHDGEYFPIYSGSHEGEWDACVDCHTNSNNYAEFTCTTCHTNPETDEEHEGVGGYVYESNACLACHPTGEADDGFNHNETAFPLTGVHFNVDCIECHADGFEGTPTDCASCHLENFNQTTNPNHTSLGLSTDCASCHNTIEPDWMGASFDIHDDFYALNGAHAAIANDCAMCHADGNFNNTPNTCIGCHTEDFNQTTNPDHEAAQFPTDCESCHSETAWTPSSFNHDEFYVLDGAHAAVAEDCAMCHIDGNFSNTPNTCAGCHTQDFSETVNPNHTALNLSTDCESCHTTQPDWMPATFDVHDEFYALNGAHAAIANDCAACHNGDYTSTPNTCFGCHSEDYNQTTNPNHQAAQFSTDCASCHSESEWIPATFDHDGEYFPIYSGSHEGEWDACVDCHTNSNNYAEFTCTTCHSNPETDEEHEGVGGYVYESNACLACHPIGEADDGFNHNETAFPLTGVHFNVDCIECHADGFEGTPTDCASCHLENFNQTTNPNHTSLGLSTDCASCHNTIEPDWMGASFDIHDDFYPLNGAHAAIANDCAMCHADGNFNNTPNTCAGCHTEDFNQTTNPDHEAAQFPTDCESCHSETAWTPSSFNHDEFYVLDGAHATIAEDCAMCHIDGNFSNTPNTCAGCHTQDFSETVNPNHTALNLSTDCESCHTTQPDWMPATFDVHDEFYALNGAHAAIANDCAACHNGDYTSTPNTCFGCHSEDYNQTTNPNHQAAQFSTDCASCHSESEWIPATFDHDGEYFPIYSGSHEGEWDACVDCHTNSNNYAEFTCTTCHTNPETDEEHEGVGGYVYESNACLACHPTGEADDGFNHNETAFPLTGVHFNVDCIECHADGFEGTPTDCASCHLENFNQTTNPNHTSLGLSTDCASCHNTIEPDWMGASFDIHDEFYPLNGAHAAIANDCAMCHADGNFNNTPNTCIGCHTEDFNQTTNPDHEAAQFPTDCESCHSETAWTPSSFNHDEFYVLDGAHAVIENDCAMCHIDGNFTNTPNTCIGCHTEDFNQTTNPDHEAAQFPTDCESCHSETAWTPSSFNHDEFYVLDGAHAVIENDCAMCHIDGNFTNTPNTCIGCHTEDFNQTTNPDHEAAQFPTDCESCHSETAWTPSSFNHDEFYVLEGGHLAIANDCAMCHVDGNFTNTPNTCAGCHTQDYNETNNPSHTTLNLSTNCESCHTTEPDWMPATFDVHNEFYALNGAHAAIANDCAACHNGDYTNTPNTCFGCHADDYNQANNPNHQNAGFPTTCEDCHSETAWIPSTFNHDDMYFPIYSGKHEGEWNQCSECHTVANNFSVFNCLECHEHNDPNDLAEEHEDVSGYSYESNACYACHPTGED